MTRVRWFAVFDQALRSNDVIAVWGVVEQHLERPLTKPELAAARRAANRYATAAHVRVIRVPEPAGTGRIRSIPLLARPDANLDDVGRLTAIAVGTIAADPSLGTAGRRRRSAGGAAERATSQVGAVVTAVRRSRRLPVTRLGRDQASDLADQLEAAARELGELTQRLRAVAGKELVNPDDG